MQMEPGAASACTDIDTVTAQKGGRGGMRAGEREKKFVIFRSFHLKHKTFAGSVRCAKV